MELEYKEPGAHGTDKLLGDSLRQYPKNLMFKFNQDLLLGKLMNGSFATAVHVDIIIYVM